MLAIQPPNENALAIRAAAIDLVRFKLAPLFPAIDDLDALPAWLWSLPAHEIARSLGLDAPFLARELAIKLERETARRHPGDVFADYLAEHRPHLSSIQQARLADFAQTLKEERANRLVVDYGHMARRGFTAAECERFTQPAFELIEAVAKLDAPDRLGGSSGPADMLRTAGTRAHARRAFADGDLEPDAAAAARATRPRAVAAGVAAQ